MNQVRVATPANRLWTFFACENKTDEQQHQAFTQNEPVT